MSLGQHIYKVSDICRELGISNKKIVYSFITDFKDYLSAKKESVRGSKTWVFDEESYNTLKFIHSLKMSGHSNESIIEGIKNYKKIDVKEKVTHNPEPLTSSEDVTPKQSRTANGTYFLRLNNILLFISYLVLLGFLYTPVKIYNESLLYKEKRLFFESLDLIDTRVKFYLAEKYKQYQSENNIKE